LPMPACSYGYIVTRRDVLRCPEAIHIIHLIILLPEKTDLPQKHLAVIVNRIYTFAYLERFFEKIVIDVSGRYKLPVSTFKRTHAFSNIACTQIDAAPKIKKMVTVIIVK